MVKELGMMHILYWQRRNIHMDMVRFEQYHNLSTRRRPEDAMIAWATDYIYSNEIDYDKAIILLDRWEKEYKKHKKWQNQ